MPKAQKPRKAKRTFSLSRDAVSYLEAVRKAKRQPSLSATIEEVVRQHQQSKEMERVSASVTRYYDSLTDQEVTEDKAWGDFAMTQLGGED